MSDANNLAVDLSRYKLGWHDDIDYIFKPKKGLNEAIVREMSWMKGEPDWMLKARLDALRRFEKRPMPSWGPDLTGIDFDDIYYYIKPTEQQVSSWEELPDAIKNTYEKLGIPEAERNFLAGVTAQMESEVVFHRNREDLERMGIIFCDMDTALREYPELVKQYWGKVIPPGDNKFASLNTSVWSGGSFIYVPPGVEVPMPLQAYFRINSENMGQFERTLIIADEGSKVHYLEGCSGTMYTTDSLHSAVVEIVVKPSARVTYTTIQNWSPNVYNLVTKRARVEAEGHMEWIDGNLGCLASGSRIYTPSGPKPIEDVQPGELVASFDGENMVWAEVKAKKFSGVQPVHEVRCGERSLLATANHPFYAWSYDPDRPSKLGRYEFAWTRLDRVKEMGKALIPNEILPFGDDVKIELPSTVRVFGGGNQYQQSFTSTRTRTSRLSGELEAMTADLAWLLGAYVGDGSIEVADAKDGGLRWARVTFAIPGKKRCYAKLMRIMGDLCPEVPPKERSDGRATRWASVELVEWLHSLGMVGTARTKRVPEWAFSAPEEIRAAFIAGYIDTDGHAAGTQIAIKSVNKDLLQDVARLLTDMGIFCRINTEFEGEREIKILDHISTAHGSHMLTMDADKRIVSRMSPVIVEKMKSRIRQIHQTVGRSNLVVPDCLDVRDVKVSDETTMLPTWDIEVAGTGCFVAEGFLVHNSQITAKYPAVYMVGPKASGEVLSVAYAGPGQHQDTGAKMVHAAPETTSKIVSKSISKDGGRTSYRGLVRVEDDAYGCRSHVQCDALILDDQSISDTFPYMEVGTRDAVIGHEATVSKVADEQLFYLMSRGLTEEQAMGMIVNGFIEPVTRTLPMEYAVEWSRLIELQMDGSVG